MDAKFIFSIRNKNVKTWKDIHIEKSKFHALKELIDINGTDMEHITAIKQISSWKKIFEVFQWFCKSILHK